MNPLYQMLNQRPVGGQAVAQTPASRLAMAMQAMQNPAQFVRQQFPDIPEDMMNNPQAILGYLQRTRGISNQQIQQIQNTYNADGTVR